MTDNKPDNTSGSGSATPHDKPANKQAAAGPRPAKPSRRSALVIAILVLILIIAALAGTVWYQHRAMQERGDALLSQAQQSAQTARTASSEAAQALALAQQQAERIERMQASLGEAQQHLQSLEQALQMLTDSGADIALVNDVDHLVSIAHQQLLLGGNVSNAIIALETAQAQLARANRPGLASLQQAINGDVERLRAVSTIDINRLSSRIDELGRLVETAPLLIPDDAAPAVASSSRPARPSAPPPAARASDPAAPWWKQGMASVADWSRQTWWTIKQDLGNFINVRRVDDAAALLMSPEQAGSLRDKLRLRLMTAQLALLMKQPDVWNTETRAVVQLLQARYDINSVEGHRALRLALQLADTSIQVELPTVANSQNAIQTLREEHAKSSQDGAGDADDAGTSSQGGGASTQEGASPQGGDASQGGETNGQDGAAQDGTPQDAAPNGSSPAGGEGADAPANGGSSPSNGGSESGNGADSGDAGTPADDGESPATASARRSVSGASVRQVRLAGGSWLDASAPAAPARIDQAGV